jgi:hypothetical protein
MQVPCCLMPIYCECHVTFRAVPNLDISSIYSNKPEAIVKQVIEQDLDVPRRINLPHSLFVSNSGDGPLLERHKAMKQFLEFVPFKCFDANCRSPTTI